MYVYWEYEEWVKSSNEISLFIYWEYAKWICLYTENKRNGSVHTENTRNAQKVEYIGKFKTKIENFLGYLSWALMG